MCDDPLRVFNRFFKKSWEYGILGSWFFSLNCAAGSYLQIPSLPPYSCGLPNVPQLHSTVHLTHDFLMDIWFVFNSPLLCSLFTHSFLSVIQNQQVEASSFHHHSSFPIEQIFLLRSALAKPYRGGGLFPQKEEVELTLLGLRSKYAHSLDSDAHSAWAMQLCCPSGSWTGQ